jgi:hypothetical protein
MKLIWPNFHRRKITNKLIPDIESQWSSDIKEEYTRFKNQMIGITWEEANKINNDVWRPKLSLGEHILISHSEIPTMQQLVQNPSSIQKITVIDMDHTADIKYYETADVKMIMEDLFEALLCIEDHIIKDVHKFNEMQRDLLKNKKSYNYILISSLGYKNIDIERELITYSYPYMELLNRDINNEIKKSFPTLEQLNNIVKGFSDENIDNDDLLAKVDDFLYYSYKKIEPFVDKILLQYSGKLTNKSWYKVMVEKIERPNIKTIAPITPIRPNTAPIQKFVPVLTPRLTKPVTVSRSKTKLCNNIITGQEKKFIRAVTPHL